MRLPPPRREHTALMTYARAWSFGRIVVVRYRPPLRGQHWGWRVWL